MIARGWIIVAFIAAAVLTGVIAALSFHVGPPTRSTDTADHPRITSLAIGTPTGQNREVRSPIGELTSASTYGPGDLIALQLKSDAPRESSFTVGVRLVKSDGTFVPFSPDSITVTGGRSGHCCWEAPPSGIYNMQIFRPDGTLSALPLHVR